MKYSPIKPFFSGSHIYLLIGCYVDQRLCMTMFQFKMTDKAYMWESVIKHESDIYYLELQTVRKSLCKCSPEMQMYC